MHNPPGDANDEVKKTSLNHSFLLLWPSIPTPSILLCRDCGLACVLMVVRALKPQALQSSQHACDYEALLKMCPTTRWGGESKCSPGYTLPPFLCMRTQTSFPRALPVLPMFMFWIG